MGVGFIKGRGFLVVVVNPIPTPALPLKGRGINMIIYGVAAQFP